MQAKAVLYETSLAFVMHHGGWIWKLTPLKLLVNSTTVLSLQAYDFIKISSTSHRLLIIFAFLINAIDIMSINSKPERKWKTVIRVNLSCLHYRWHHLHFSFFFCPSLFLVTLCLWINHSYLFTVKMVGRSPTSNWKMLQQQLKNGQPTTSVMWQRYRDENTRFFYNAVEKHSAFAF